MKKRRILHCLPPACALALLIPLGLTIEGCTRGHFRSSTSTVTPGLTAEDRKHGRNGTNPNAPFTLISRAERTSPSREVSFPLDAAPCAPENLGVVEVAEQVNGEERFVSLAFVNVGERLCKLGGYPALSLLDENGVAIGSLSVVEVPDTTQLAAVPTPAASAIPLPAPATIELMLAPQGEAYFGISWVTGAECPQVSGLAVRAPGMVRSFSINHHLSVCSGQVRVTALRSTQHSG